MWVGAAAAVVLVFAFISLFRSCSPGPPVREEPFRGLMRVLAEEVAGLVDGEGEVVLIPEDREGMNVGFREAMSRHKKIRLITAEIPANPMPGIATFSPDALRRIVATHPEADGFVSLRGLPMDFHDELRASSAKRQRWAVVYSIRMDGVAEDFPFDLVIIPRSSSEAPGGKPKSAREWFDRYYTILRNP